MNLPHAKTNAIAVSAAVLLVAGLWQAGSGAWIYVKADLAQVLLQRAWASTLRGNTHAKPWPWADTWPVARLIVPSRHIDQIVLEGAYGRTLAFGPGRVESNEPAREAGTMILTGHRDTHFRFLEKLQPGETILLQARTGVWRRFTVRTHQIVDARTASIRTDEDGEHLILVTCYPFLALRPNTPFRYIVIADLEPMADGRYAEEGPNWKTSDWSSSWLSISRAAQDCAPTTGPCPLPWPVLRDPRDCDRRLRFSATRPILLSAAPAPHCVRPGEKFRPSPGHVGPVGVCARRLRVHRCRRLLRASPVCRRAA